MVRDALRGYLGLAGGMTEVTAARALAAARSLVEQGEATAGQVSALAEDLVATTRRNHESLMLVVRHEVEQAARRFGVGAAGDVDALVQRVRRLERSVRELQAGRGSPSASDAAVASNSSSGTTSAAKKTAKKQSTAKKSSAKKTAAKQNTAKKSSAKKTAAKQNTAKKSSAKKSANKTAKKSATT